DYTVAISALKPAHVIHPACDNCGDIIIANIGIPEESYNFVKDSLYTYNKTEVKNLFPKRAVTANKGSFGHVLCICGSRNMVGASVLCASAALRSGAGLVTVAFPKSIYLPVANKLTQALFMPLEETEDGTFSEKALGQLLPVLDKYDAVVIGCGIGVNEDTTALVKGVLQNSKVPVIVDADAINIIAKDISILKSATSRVVLTPHPKEMSRLVGTPVEIIQSDRVTCAKAFAHANDAYVVLKGSNTVVASPGSQRVYVNASGNSGLAKGGSGDVLAGLIGGFAVQDFELTDAVCSAVYVHGYTGDTVADKYSKSGMLPEDVVSELRYTLKDFEK
ncbi:MAG: NAD(P)H-hydrate dehydratase, partial [Clostridia bacterium]|nr:NAD(P)H-hydrate dehydratase [Clostridia bacterium]